MAKLTFILQDGQEVEVQLREDITIGRSEDNEVVVDAPMISARHARVRKSGRDAFEVFDLQSEGGTFVNDERVNQHQLSHGDRLKFGHLHAVFAHDAAESQRQQNQPQVARDDRFDWLGGDRGLPKHETAPVDVSQPFNAPRGSASDPKVDEERIQALKETSEALEKKIQQQKRTIAELEQQVEENRAGSEAIVDEVQMLEARRDTALSDMRDAHVRTETLQAAAVRAEESRARDEERLKALLDEITQADKARTEALQQQEQVQSALTAGQEKLLALQAETNATTDQLALLNGEVEQKRLDVEGLLSKLEALQQEEGRLQDVISQTAEIEQRHAEAASALQKLEENCRSKEERMQELAQLAQTALEDCQSMQKQRNDEQAQLQQVLKELGSASESLNATRDELADKSLKLQQTLAVQQDRDQQVSALQGMLGHLQTNREQLSQKVERLAGTEERLLQAMSELDATQQIKAGLEQDITELAARRLADEKAESDLKNTLQKLAEDTRRQEVTLQQLVEKNAIEGATLAQTSQTLTSERADLAKLRHEAEAASKLTAAEIERAKSELADVKSKLEQTQQQLTQTETRRAAIAQECTDLADVEGKLGSARVERDKLSKAADDLQAKISDLTQQKLGLEDGVKDLTGQKKGLTSSVRELEGRKADLSKILEELTEQERVDRERFKEIQNLVSDAEHERSLQIGHLDRQILLKQRELLEVEERLEALRQWKEEMERRYEEMETLAEDSEDARARWRSMNAEKGQLGQFIAESEASRATAYSNGPVLRGHARQLEAKIRRDEDRYATLHRKVENLAVEEMDRSERVASLERRLAQLRVDVARAEREHLELGLEQGGESPSQNQEPAPEPASKSILSSIIDGARSRLKPMVQQRED